MGRAPARPVASPLAGRPRGIRVGDTIANVDAAAFRSQFPVLERSAYLNTGTDGPIPTRSLEAAHARLRKEVLEGRSGAIHSMELRRMAEELRVRLAALLGAHASEIALTRSTTDGINTVLGGLGLRAGDEILTSDEEHAGLLAPLGALAKRSGVRVCMAPLADVPEAVGGLTKLIAVSHVSWLTGAIAPVDALRRTGVPLLLDGAQSLGALPVDVGLLECDYFAAAGQKWLCGPDATGVLFVKEDRIEELGMPWPSFITLGDAERPLDLVPGPGARRFDSGMIAGPLVAGALGSLTVLEEAGWPWVFERGVSQAGKLREILAAHSEVLPGGPTTLVSWQPGGVSDASGAIEAVERLAQQDVIVRSLPGKPWLRASVGAWNSDEDLARLQAVV